MVIIEGGSPHTPHPRRPEDARDRYINKLEMELLRVKTKAAADADRHHNAWVLLTPLMGGLLMMAFTLGLAF